MVDITIFILCVNPFKANLFIVIPSYYSSELEEVSKYAVLIIPQHSNIKFCKQFQFKNLYIMCYMSKIINIYYGSLIIHRHKNHGLH